MKKTEAKKSRATLPLIVEVDLLVGHYEGWRYEALPMTLMS
jgi:hypothetical protein